MPRGGNHEAAIFVLFDQIEHEIGDLRLGKQFRRPANSAAAASEALLWLVHLGVKLNSKLLNQKRH